MTAQLKELGLSYDWDRIVATCKPDYYRWMQWIFIQFYKKGLAYKKDNPVNWCPSCQTVLANEQVVDGKCERCKSPVTKKSLSQWYFKITDYADRLLENLDKLPGWPEKVKTMQRNWIGKSHGAQITFKIDGFDKDMDIYTTRADTLYGVTYMVMAPEHPYLQEMVAGTEYEAAVNEYVEKVQHMSDIDRTSTSNEKTGVFTGRYAINPINGKKVPIFISDYVLMGYGTGAIMAVTYMVMAPEHPYLQEMVAGTEYEAAVNEYVEKVQHMSDIDRTSTSNEKTGVFTGRYAINPINGKKVPIFISDYVLMGYGTGAIMAVPAHDTRDFDFAKKFDCEIIPVVDPGDTEIDLNNLTEAFVAEGTMLSLIHI